MANFVMWKKYKHLQRSFVLDRVIGTVVVLALITLAVSGMVFAWRKKVEHAKRFTLIVPGHHISEDNPVKTFSTFYVATTMATDPLVRITLPGLSFRAHGFIDLSPTTFGIRLHGEKPTIIPTSQIIQLHTAQVTIDKAVEKDGLIAISWQAFDNNINEIVEFTSYFRFTNPQDNVAFKETFSQLYPDISQKGVSS